MTVKLLRHFLNITINSKDLFDQTKDMAVAYSTCKKLAVQWLNEALCFESGSVVADSFRLRNRQLLLAANRYTALK